MIDLSWHAPATAFDAAAAGDDRVLRDSLTAHGATDDAAGQLLAAVRAPHAVLEVLQADVRGALRQRAYLGTGLSSLHADGDDREEVRAVLVAPSPAELVHALLAGLGLGPRPAHDAATLEAAPDAVHLDRTDQAIDAVRGAAELPAQVQVIGDPSEHRWWGLRWYAPDQPERTARLQVLDVGRLWVQDGTALVPADAVGVLTLLSPLLGELSRLAARASGSGEDGS